MATQRKRYFKVADSVGDETWSNDELATIVRLMARMNTRWARNGLTVEEASRISLSLTDVMAISGKRRRDVAVTSLARLADFVSMSVECLGEVVTIHWPKFAEFQYSDTRTQGKAGAKSGDQSPPPLPRPASRDTQPQLGEGEAPAAPASAPPPPASARGRTSTKIPKPHSFTGEARDRIQAWATERGYDRSALNAGLERFREWAPLKTQNRTISQWVGAFMRIVREGVEDGKISAKSGSGPRGEGSSPGGGARRSADLVLAEARQKQAETDLQARSNDDPETVARAIERSLRPALALVHS